MLYEWRSVASNVPKNVCFQWKIFCISVTANLQLMKNKWENYCHSLQHNTILCHKLVERTNSHFASRFMLPHPSPVPATFLYIFFVFFWKCNRYVNICSFVVWKRRLVWFTKSRTGILAYNYFYFRRRLGLNEISSIIQDYIIWIIEDSVKKSTL